MSAAKKGTGLSLPLSRLYVSVSHTDTGKCKIFMKKNHKKCRNFYYIGFVDLNTKALHTTLSHFHRRQEKGKRVNFAPVKRVF